MGLVLNFDAHKLTDDLNLVIKHFLGEAGVGGGQNFEG
jgi:hypothetical protein